MRRGGIMYKLYISQLLMLGIVVWTGLGAGTIAIFINAPSLIIIFVFALLFSIAGTKNLKSRVHNFADGAVLGGWIGLLIGGIAILHNQDFYNWEETTLPISCAIMLLTVFYGYVLKAACFLIAENLPEEQSSR